MSALEPTNLVRGKEYIIHDAYHHKSSQEVFNKIDADGFVVFGMGGNPNNDNPDYSLFYEVGDPGIPVITPLAAYTPPVINNANEGEPFISARNGKGDLLCPICMEELSENIVACETTQERATGTESDKVECGHKYHRDCINTSFEKSGKRECPVCKGIVKRLRRARPEPTSGGSRRQRKHRRTQRKNRRRSSRKIRILRN